MELQNNELLQVQIKLNSKILVSEKLESTPVDGYFESNSLEFLNVVVFQGGFFVTTKVVKRGRAFSCLTQVDNNVYSHIVNVYINRGRKGKPNTYRILSLISHKENY